MESEHTIQNPKPVLSEAEISKTYTELHPERLPVQSTPRREPFVPLTTGRDERRGRAAVEGNGFFLAAAHSFYPLVS